MADYEVFNLARVELQCGLTLSSAKLAYKTFGDLNSACDNAIIMPTFYAGQHADIEVMINAWRALDPKKYFIIIPNMFGNGLSSSPSNTAPPFDRGAFPQISLYDNVCCQHQLLAEHLGVQTIRLAVGFSMGAQQVYQWSCLYPEMVEAIA